MKLWPGENKQQLKFLSKCLNWILRFNINSQTFILHNSLISLALWLELSIYSLHWLLAQDKLQLQFPKNVQGRQIQATELKLKLNINDFQKGAQFLYRFSSS